jgi:deoxyribose-phosphate aldolase
LFFETAAHLAGILDASLLKPDATREDLTRHCGEAREYGFYAICIQPCYVTEARRLLEGSPVRLCTVVGFPLGATTTPVKIVEAMEAVQNGADELDIMINLGTLKSRRYGSLLIEMKNIVKMTPQVVHKMILETGYLTDEEKAEACRLAMEAGAEFIKTSTGFGPAATVEDVRLIRQVVGSNARVKAAGGIHDVAAVEAFVRAGADRIGTSTGVSILKEYALTAEGRGTASKTGS